MLSYGSHPQENKPLKGLDVVLAHNFYEPCKVPPFVLFGRTKRVLKLRCLKQLVYPETSKIYFKRSHLICIPLLINSHYYYDLHSETTTCQVLRN